MKKVVSIILALVMVLSMSSVALAAKGSGSSDDPLVFTINTAAANTAFGTTTNTVLGIIQFIGYAIGTGMLIYIAIKYMMASANEKAELKKGAINWVIGAILLFAGSTLLGAIGNMFS